jgi:hypothetical protein
MASSSATKLCQSGGPFGRFWRWQRKFDIQQFSSSASAVGIGASSTPDMIVAQTEAEEWNRVLQMGRQMPWSTSKVRKLFQASTLSMAGTAEQTEMDDYLSDRHSFLGGEARKGSSDLEKLTPSVPALATILMGKMMCSSNNSFNPEAENESEKTALEKVQQEEL